MKINGNLSFHTLGDGEVQNAIIERLTAAPTGVAGRIYYNTGGVTEGDKGYWYHDGTTWQKMATGGNATALQTEVDKIEAALGTGIDANGDFVAGSFSAFTNVTTPTSFTNVLSQLDAAISSADQLSELDDVQLGLLGAGQDNNLLQYAHELGKWSNSAIGSASGVQAYDAGLDALAAFNTDGILVQTANDTFVGRSLVAPAAGFTISDANGVGGNPTFALANDLAAVEGLATNGFAVRTADGVWATRSITPSTGRITVTNTDGVSGSPTIDLDTLDDGGTGTFLKFTRDSYGRVSGTTAVVTSDITALVDSTYVNVEGDTMTGNLVFSTGTVTGLASPTGATDAATKGYVDSLAGGLSWQEPVDSVGATNPVSATTGDRFLNTTDGKIYTATDTDTWNSGVVPVDGWSLFDRTDETGYVYSGSAWVQFTGTGQITAGLGLAKNGNVIDVNLGAGIKELPSDEVGVDIYGAPGALILTTDGTTASTNTSAALHLLLKSAGGLIQDVDGLYVPDNGITNAMILNDTITLDADTGSGSLALGGTLDIIGVSAQGTSVSVAGTQFIVTAADATTTTKGVASFNADQFSVTTGAVSLAATLSDLTNVDTSTDAPAQDSILAWDAGTWKAVDPSTVLDSASIDDFADVVITSAADNQALIHNGTNWVNQKIYHLHTQGSASASWTVTHDIGQQYVNVTVVDGADEVIIPQSIVFTSTTVLTVTFNTAITGKVVVMGIA
jgi:hypothetical protein